MTNPVMDFDIDFYWHWIFSNVMQHSVSIRVDPASSLMGAVQYSFVVKFVYADSILVEGVFYSFHVTRNAVTDCTTIVIPYAVVAFVQKSICSKFLIQMA
jgi:hypothetical protein